MITQNFSNDVKISSKTIACLGEGWFSRSPGGLNRYVYELTQALALGGDRVNLFGIDLPETGPHSHIQLHNLASAKSSLLHRLWHVRSHFAHYAPTIAQADGINCHFALYNLPILSQLPSTVPLTFTFHGPWALESQWEGAKWWNVQFKFWLEQRVFQRCDRFIVLSKAFGNILHQIYGIPWDKIHIIPGGVDVTRFQNNLTRQQAREKLNWPHDRLILFTPRRLVQRMGLDHLLAAIAQTQTPKSDVWLAIAGKGPLRETLENQVKALNLEHQVKFLGFLPDADLPTAYQAADLTVMPSQSLEGFGLVLLESLACGTPVLCTPVGGMPEIIQGFSPELITQTSATDSLAETLHAIANGQIQLPDRQACRDYACQNYDWHRIVQQVRNVIIR